ncbi:MAG: hypothetical protein H7A49_13225 [Akkermansiaceae bacterium]|nr:hypothetical protein [Akkermansiaceae bacterium]MCP5547180.1 hypothetical protein [Akkermansiaceae bacterium]
MKRLFPSCLLRWSALLAMSAPCHPSVAQGVPGAVATVEIRRTVNNGFVHPGIGMSKEMLVNARDQVAAGREPWSSAFRKLAAHPHSAETVSCRNQSTKDPSEPDSDTFDSRGMEARLKGDADKALRQALMFWFTGREAHRANAMNIIRTWSKMDPKKYKSFPEDHIHTSYPIQDLIRAAELMRCTSSPKRSLEWTGRDNIAFIRNFVTPCVSTFLDRNGHFMNQAGYPMAAAMAGDIFTNNRKSYEKRVEWFTINKDAPNKGWSFSIRDLARLVDTNAATGEKVSPPNAQLVEMGRDQAHAGGDVDIFMNIARMMNVQGTKVDPVTGTISTKEEAVGPYEFLDDRILAIADHFCRFMLGYDTPWIPTPSDIAPDGTVRQIYYRIADNYRGRIRGLDFWDAHHYYTYTKGIDVSKKAPYYHEAFTKRIVNSDFDWITIPKEVKGEGARVPQTVQEPDVVEIEERSTTFDKNASIATEGKVSFLRIKPAAKGTRIALLSCDTDRKTIGMRVRTTGVTEIQMSVFRKPWLLPDTKGEWKQVSYRMDDLEDLGDIVYFTVTARDGTVVDLDQLVRKPEEGRTAPEFTLGNDDLRIVACVGIPLELDLSAKGPRGGIRIECPDLPDGATLGSNTGAFQWTPSAAGESDLVVTAVNGEFVTPKRIHIVIAADRAAAVDAAGAGYEPGVPYVSASLAKCKELNDRLAASMDRMSPAVFSQKLLELQDAFGNLEPLTPLLPDGSMDFPKVVVTTTTKEGEIALLTDGNDDTYAVFPSAQRLGHTFDFGAAFRFSAEAFAVEGRMNFETRTQDVVFLGSDDGESWTPLTDALTKAPVELTRIEVLPGQRGKRFRFLRFQKTSDKSDRLFEPAELRIFGERHEAARQP